MSSTPLRRTSTEAPLGPLVGSEGTISRRRVLGRAPALAGACGELVTAITGAAGSASGAVSRLMDGGLGGGAVDRNRNVTAASPNCNTSASERGAPLATGAPFRSVPLLLPRSLTQ